MSPDQTIKLHPDAREYGAEVPEWVGYETRVRAVDLVGYDADGDEVDRINYRFSSNPHYPTMADCHKMAQGITARLT